MRNRFPKACVLAVALVIATADPSSATPLVGVPGALPRPPVCEPSAALAMPCSGDATATCVWVGDNEQDGRLFQYSFDDQGVLAPAEPFVLEPKGLEVGDVEALARSADGVLVFGSHSRKSDCNADQDRAAVARVTAGGQQAEPLSGRQGFADRTSDCPGWVAIEDPAAGGASALRDRFCRVMGAVERMNDDVAGDRKGCPGSAFNIEGAVSVEQEGKLRTWVGLRGPLVDGYAVLLRVADRPPTASKRRLQFDGIATVDLGQRGIRELTDAGGSVWGIAGCVADCKTPSRLWRIAASSLVSGAVLGATAVEMLAGVELPASAEGLVVQPDARRAIVLIDGNQGKSDDTCGSPEPRQMTIGDLPQ